MHAYLFIGNNTENVDKRIADFFPNTLDNTLVYEVTKIEDVRNLRKDLKLARNTLAYIKIVNIDSATTEAQNAFLKNLEEPPNNIIFLLKSTSETNILPTILSRCQLVRCQNLFDYPKKDMTDFIEKVTIDKMAFLTKIQKKEDAIKFITNLIYYCHDMLKNGNVERPKILHLLKSADKTLVNLKANGNVYLQLLNFSISVN